MKYIFLNLKRFDIPPELGGVNRLAPMPKWGGAIVTGVQEKLFPLVKECRFPVFFPEAHILNAAAALMPDSPVELGCQGVFRQDTAVGGNFGAFTTNRTAHAAAVMGCQWTMIGHCEERRDKAGILAEAGVTDTAPVNRILNQEVRRAIEAGLNVLYCIGETAEESPRRDEVLREQLTIGLEGVDTTGGKVVIAYEPVWAIGPGKTPPGRDFIQEVARVIGDITGGLDVVYGGGLKADNAEMLASIPEIAGGLIALTRFTGEIGFYPEEYLEIIRLYLGK